MANGTIDATDEPPPPRALHRGLASAGALVVALLLILLVVLVTLSTRERDAALARERHSYGMMMLTRTLDVSMARSEAALGRFVISGDKRVGALYYDEWRRAGRMLARLRELSAGNPEQAPLIAELTTLYEQRGKELAVPATRAYFRQGWPALSTFNKAGESETVPRIASLLERIANNERTLFNRRADSVAEMVTRSNSLTALLSGLGLLLVLSAILLGWAALQALAQRRLARHDAHAEAERAEVLEQAVAERTAEMRRVNARLIKEAAERAATEDQLRQAQKMEVVGQLTGGIAHDFNNMLAVVVGGLDLARRALTTAPAQAARHIDNALEGANRAAALTRRLLTFARAEPLLPKALDPGALIAGMSDLLDRTLGERIAVETRLAPETWQIWCDPHQLENAILNLAVNARDAMEGEGRLTIATSNVAASGGEGLEATGDRVRIAVTDTGCGMTPDVLEHAFEPFFTTKPVGKGTGLGLSQIFGFARQSDGQIEIGSAPDQGTTVSLYLPRFTGEQAAHNSESAPTTAAEAVAAPPADTTILVVEDDARVSAATSGALEELGYKALVCASGGEAITLLASRSDIRLILADVVMPGMTGPELVARVAPLYPDIAILYVTGYVAAMGEASETAMSAYEVLRKPFTVTALGAAVTRALGDATPKASARRLAPAISAEG
jgi:signal transduction histidine kinase/ActR/RegA family two-component response regulator